MIDAKLPLRGKLAAEAGKVFPLEVCKSAAGSRLRQYSLLSRVNGSPFSLSVPR